MLLRRLAAAILAAGVVLTALGVSAAASGERDSVSRQTKPGGQLAGEGASFPCGYIDQAIGDAQDLDLTVTYGCDGSGKGRGAFIAGTVDFAGTDVPLSAAEIAQLDGKHVAYLQLAYVGGGIAVAYNPGSGLPYNLNLSADALGKIFSGRIVNWDDPQLARENPGTSLPDLKLRVAARADSSGTSHAFTSFLAVTSQSWPGGARDIFDSPPLPSFPGLLLVDGSAGVADAVRDNPGMIGYVELSFARERKLDVGAVEGSAGYVLPDSRAVADAVAALRLGPDGTVTPKFAAGPGYPISIVTYLLVRQEAKNRQAATNLRAFADLLLENNKKAASLAYAPLPVSIVDYAEQQIATIGPGGGAPPSTASTTSTTVPASTTTAAPPSVEPTSVAPAPPTTRPVTTPVTGSTSPWLIVLGVGLIAFGSGLMRLSRPRMAPGH